MQLNIANIRRPPTVAACAAETNRRAAVWSSAVRPAAAREAPLIPYDTDASVNSQLQEIAKTVIR